MTQIRISIKSQSLILKILVSRIFIKELSKSLDTLNNNILILAFASTIRLITRLLIIRNKFLKRVSTRYKILKIYYNFILNLFILLIKINALKFYKS